MPEGDAVARRDYTRKDAFNPDNNLEHSKIENLSIPAKYRQWGEPVKVEVPWGKLEYWNMIVSVETVGDNEPQQYEDNKFVLQQVKIEEDTVNNIWLVSGICLFGYFPGFDNPQEPGVNVRAKALIVLK